jgi:hypothetical protein
MRMPIEHQHAPWKQMAVSRRITSMSILHCTTLCVRALDVAESCFVCDRFSFEEVDAERCRLASGAHLYHSLPTLCSGPAAAAEHT